jgi:hypothetical protein
MQQIFRILATSNADALARPGKRRQLASLLYVAVQQDEKLGGMISTFVPLHVDIASQQGEHVFAGNFLADSSHAQE